MPKLLNRKLVKSLYLGDEQFFEKLNQLEHTIDILNFEDISEEQTLKSDSIWLIILDLINPKFELESIKSLYLKFTEAFVVYRVSNGITTKNLIDIINLRSPEKIWREKDDLSKISLDLDLLWSKFENVYLEQVMLRNYSRRLEKQNSKSNSMIELMASIEGDKQKQLDFVNNFVQIMKGYVTMGEISFHIFINTTDYTALDTTITYIEDLDSIANLQGQKYLSLLFNSILSYLYIIKNDLKKALKYDLAVNSLLKWLELSKIQSTLLFAIQSFPVDSDTKVSDLDSIKSEIYETIGRLFKIDLEDLLTISLDLLKFDDSKLLRINHLIVIRESLPIYHYSDTDTDTEATLLGGFVVALSDFLKETLQESAEIKTINYEGGVISIYRIRKNIYVLIANDFDIRHRVGLRDFAIKSNPIIDSLAESELPGVEESSILSNNLKSCFFYAED